MHTYKKHLGASLWVLSIQYYVIQLLTAEAWPTNSSYSWAQNTISDLANTHCGWYGSRYVCSPQHLVMNISFVLLGSTMIGGAYLLAKYFAESITSKIGFGCMALAGIGTILVGLFPENAVSALHVLGATLAFTLGNVGMIILGLRLGRLPRMLQGYTVLSGIVGLIALVLFRAHVYAGIGIGGMERFVGYPQSIWMIIFGLYSLIIFSRYNGRDEKNLIPNNSGSR